MIRTQLALLQRELWEHRSIYVTPLIIALIVTLMSITGQVAISAFDQAVDLAIIGASNLGPAERAAAISVVSAAISSFFIMAMGVLTFFYLIDALYAERRDKSILYWRSLPVSDAETVVSKLVTALLVIPLITFVVVAVTHLVVLAVSGIWVGGRGGDAWHLIWADAPLFKNWLATLVLFIALPLWFMPLTGWFLFVSAWTKRSPFLVAVLPLIVLPMVERIVIGTSFLRDAIFVRSARLPLFDNEFGETLMRGEMGEMNLPSNADVSFLAVLDVPGFLASPALWSGIVVGCLFTAAAVYVRRYRDDS